MRWARQDSRWQLLQCHLAPDFPPSASMRPDGWICDSLHNLPELQFFPEPLNLHDLLMLSAQDDATPPGFQFLSRWSDTIAHLHDLPIASLQLVFDHPSKHEPVQLGQQPTIIGRGNRSLVLRLDPAADWIVKISSANNFERELAIHAAADANPCRFLRRLKLKCSGTMMGAGEGLHFLGLQPYAMGSLCSRHCDTPATIKKLADQVRGRWTTPCC